MTALLGWSPLGPCIAHEVGVRRWAIPIGRDRSLLGPTRQHQRTPLGRHFSSWLCQIDVLGGTPTNEVMAVCTKESQCAPRITHISAQDMETPRRWTVHTSMPAYQGGSVARNYEGRLGDRRYLRVNENGIPWICEDLESLVQKILATAPDSTAPRACRSQPMNFHLKTLKPLWF